MTEEDFLSIKRHIYALVVAAIVIALDVFVWRP